MDSGDQRLRSWLANSSWKLFKGDRWQSLPLDIIAKFSMLNGAADKVPIVYSWRAVFTQAQLKTVRWPGGSLGTPGPARSSSRPARTCVRWVPVGGAGQGQAAGSREAEALCVSPCPHPAPTAAGRRGCGRPIYSQTTARRAQTPKPKKGVRARTFAAPPLRPSTAAAAAALPSPTPTPTGCLVLVL